MKIEKVCQSLYHYLIQERVFRIILPYAVFLMILCAGLQFLGGVVYLGSFVHVISYLGFYFMMLLVLSLCNFRAASIGWGIRSMQYLYYLLRSLFMNNQMNWGYVIYLIVYMYFAYQCFKKSLQINE